MQESCAGMPDYSNLPAERLPPQRPSRSVSRGAAPSAFERQRDLLLKTDWFHGVLPRDEAEKRVTNNGCFLVRESLSMRCFVVTTRWNGRHYHIAICPTASQPEGQFYFTESYAFDSVEELLAFYKNSQMPVSAESGSILFTPVTARAGHERLSTGGSRYQQRSRGHSASRSRQVAKAKNSRLKKFGSEPLLLVDGESPARPRRGSNASVEGVLTSEQPTAAPAPAMMAPPSMKSARSLSSVASGGGGGGSVGGGGGGGGGGGLDRPTVRRSSAGSLVVGQHRSRRENNAGRSGASLPPEPPPKPMRPLPRHSADVFNRPKPSVTIRNRVRYREENSNDYTDYAQVMAISSIARHSPSLMSNTSDYCSMSNGDFPSNGPPPPPERKLSLTTSQPGDAMGLYVDTYGPLPSPDPLVDAQMWSIWLNHGFLPLMAPETRHLPAFSKPLDSSVWTTVLRVLADASPELLASCAAQESCRVLLRFPQTCKIPGVRSGFQLMLLPPAEKYRQQLLERDYCLSRFVAGSILICKSHERSNIVAKWLSVAECLYSIYRDYYSLHAVVDGIFCHQVARISQPVTLLPNPSPLATAVGRDIRILHSRPDDCSLSPHVDICVPHVSRFLRCYSAAFDDLLPESPESLSDVCEAARVWAAMPEDRLWVANLPPLPAPPLLPELFTTEVQMKLLWGAKGYAVASGDRQQKLEVILDAFAKRAQASAAER